MGGVVFSGGGYPSVDQRRGDTDPVEQARALARDTSLPAWAVEVRDRLLQGDVEVLEPLERLTAAAPWLFGKGDEWAAED